MTNSNSGFGRLAHPRRTDQGTRVPAQRVRHRVPPSQSATPVPREAVGVAARTVDAVKVFGRGATTVRALDGVTVEFAQSAFTAIMGPSGSGKSTLLHCVAGLDRLTEGHAYVGDADLGALRDDDLTVLRRDRIGFVFQEFNLVPTLTAQENLTLPLRLAVAARTPSGSTPWWTPSGCAIGWRIGPANCPAGSSSAWPSAGRW